MSLLKPCLDAIFKQKVEQHCKLPVELKLGVSWAQVVDNMVPAIPTIATGGQVVSSTECAKTKHPL